MNQSPLSEPSHSPSVPLASGSSHPPLEGPAVTPLSTANGYSTGVTPTPRYNPPANPPPFGSHSSLVNTAVTPPSASNGYSKDVIQSKSTPWYRTTKGLVIIIVVALVLVGVVVGAVFGVTQSKKGNNKSGALKDQDGVTQTSASSTAGGIASGSIVPPSPNTLTPSPLITASGFVSLTNVAASPSIPTNR